MIHDGGRTRTQRIPKHHLMLPLRFGNNGAVKKCSSLLLNNF